MVTGTHGFQQVFRYLTAENIFWIISQKNILACKVLQIELQFAQQLMKHKEIQGHSFEKKISSIMSSSLKQSGDISIVL